MISYIIRRLFQLVLVLIGVSIITFIIMFVVPGDPARQLAGKAPTPQRLALIRHELGLDRPVYVQYTKFVGRLVRGDLGESVATGQDVRTMLFSAIPNTLQLAVAAVLIELLGIPLGIYSALRQYTFWDTALTTTFLLIWGIPVFVLGLFVQWFFGIAIPVNFPTVASGSSNFLWIFPTSMQNLQALILPALTLGVIEVAYISYMQRASMLEVIRTDYVRTARAKGLAETTVMFGHVLKNGMIPILTGAVVVIPTLFMGALIMESFFGIPGLGSYTIDAIQAQDFSIVRSMVFLGAVLYIVGLLMTDISYTLVDPRVRLE